MERKAPLLSDLRTEKKAYPLAASDYKLLEEIGKGFSAIVYRAKCIPLNEFVAIKAVDLERCNSNLDDVRREAQTMSLINHPNVVKAYCSFVVEQTLWVVMPFMAGGSCLHIMKAAYPEGFEETIIASFLKETLKALEYLHQQGHIHRDVKAGNILVDGNGAVKLGDFGVSACMFDTGDRQRSRSTFVGTPCWMAPEVMEQVHGYDFKADIWSFGITALELAHGHAPFSKYPPMKVLLMTLQNAPPGLDYERDRKFSKSFKEMVAMCLVKDPSKRPSAEKLLKHSFFKHAKSADYVARTILDPLPPLWERVREVKMRDEARLAEKKMPYGEQEARSQNEYKRGVSSWNFDLEDLKAQAALNDIEPPVKDDVRKDLNAAEINRASSPPLATSLQTIQDSNSCQQSDVTDHVSRPKPAPLPPKPANDSKSGHPPGKKEPKHFGRFDVFDDDPEQDALDSCNGNGGIKQQQKEEEKDNLTKEDDQRNGKECATLSTTEKVMESNHAEDKTGEHDHANEKYNHGSVIESSNEGQEDGGSKSNGKSMDENVTVPQSSKPPIPSSGLLVPSSTFYEGRSSNGLPATSRISDHKTHKESLEDKLKGQAVFQKKGRFSVTSQDDDIQEHGPSSRKNVSIQTSMQPVHKASGVNDWHLERKNTGPPLSSQSSASNGLNAATVIPQLQTLFSQTALQQELIMNMMNSINPSEQPLSLKSSSFTAKNVSRNVGLNSVDPTMVEVITERERELLSQVADLQFRVALLAEELQAVKSRNVQLERQLNAIFNKEEEERIRKEEAARDDG